MSLSHYRDAISARLQESVDKLCQSAIDMRVHHEMTADTYAMVQIDLLAQARALADARRIVIAEYKRLTEVADKEEVKEKQQEKSESVYG